MTVSGRNWPRHYKNARVSRIGCLVPKCARVGCDMLEACSRRGHARMGPSVDGRLARVAGAGVRLAASFFL